MIDFKDKNKILLGLVILFGLIIIAGLVILSSIFFSSSRNYLSDSFESIDSIAYSPAPGRMVGDSFKMADSSFSITEDRRIIKTGSLSLRVQDIEQSMDKVNQIISPIGGLVENSGLYEQKQTGLWNGWMNIKVPADKFDDIFGEIKQIASEVEREEISSRDITDEYVDIEATLRNMRAEEQQYLSIMNRAREVEEVIKVAEKLYEVRGRIERTEARLLSLSRQVEMSSINISFTSEGEINILGVNWRPSFILRKGVADMLVGLNYSFEVFIYLLFRLPIIIIWLAIIAIIIFVFWKALPIWTKYQKK